MKRIHAGAALALSVAGLCICPVRAAQPDGKRQEAASAEMRLQSPVADEVLAGMRGGFDIGNGVLASFGISRMVYINGTLVVGTRIQVPDVSHIDVSQARALAELTSGITLIRNGPGNFIDPANFRQALGGVVIQNTLDHQQIQAVTTIDATVRNLSQFNSMNLADALQRGMVNSRGQ